MRDHEGPFTTQRFGRLRKPDARIQPVERFCAASNFASGSDQSSDLATSTREFGNGARFFCTIRARFGPIATATSSQPPLEVDAELSCATTDIEHAGAGVKVPGRLETVMTSGG
ncbi:MAG: hypothetical protein ACYDHP_08100 [Ferrimicrobium sp.]